MNGEECQLRIFGIVLLILLICDVAFAGPGIRYANFSVLLDQRGNEIIPGGVYTDIVDIGYDRYAVRKNADYAVADGNGNVLTEFIYTYLVTANDRIYAGTEAGYVVLDLSGNQQTENVYSQIVPGTNGGSWGLRDGSEDLYLISEPDVERCVTGLRIAELAEASGEDMIAYRDAETYLWGYCDNAGNGVIPAKYTDADVFHSGRARTVRDGHYGVIASDGTTILEHEFDKLSLMEKRIVAELAEGEVRVYDLNGECLWKYPRTRGFAIFPPLYAVYLDDAIVLYDENGKPVESLPPDVRLTAGLNGDILVSDGQWGENSVYLLNAPDNRWQDLSPLGYTTSGTAVYRGAVLNTNIQKDAILGEEVVAFDLSTIQYAIVGADGIALTDVCWNSIEYLCGDRFLAITDDALNMIDSEGRIYYTKNVEETNTNE